MIKDIENMMKPIILKMRNLLNNDNFHCKMTLIVKRDSL